VSRLLGAALAVLVLVLGLPSSALAAPPTAGCGATGPRVAVPARFALEVCTDGHRLTVANRRSRPVQVRASGDLRRPVMLGADDGVPAAVLRAAFPDGLVLMPGDSVQWSFGGGPGTLTVGADDGAAVTAALAPYLPGQHDRALHVRVAAFSALVRGATSAVSARTACRAAGRNFLGTAACDVVAATAIGSAVHTLLPAAVATRLAGVMLDPARWTAWSVSAAAADRALAGDQVLRTGVRPPAEASPSARSPAARTSAHRAEPAPTRPAAATPRATTPTAHTAPARPTARPAPAPPAVPDPVRTDLPPQWPVPWPLPWPIPLLHPSSAGGHGPAHGDPGHGNPEPHGR
jgi:hypothetical protein